LGEEKRERERERKEVAGCFFQRMGGCTHFADMLASIFTAAWEFLAMNFIVPSVGFQKIVALKLIWVDCILDGKSNGSVKREILGSTEYVHTKKTSLSCTLVFLPQRKWFLSSLLLLSALSFYLLVIESRALQS
jgi:hypothetical protein